MYGKDKKKGMMYGSAVRKGKMGGRRSMYGSGGYASIAEMEKKCGSKTQKNTMQ
jgi:glutamate dehydrogenase/leucine dehydrogenase